MPLYPPRRLDRWLTPVHGGIATTSQTFTVGRVILVQFFVPIACQIDGVAYTVGATGAGNVIGGIVGPVSRTGDSADTAVVIAQSASTAQSVSAGTAQVLTWTAVNVAAGTYYAALEGSDATGTYERLASTPQAPGLVAFYDRAGGFGALTDPTPTTTVVAAGTNSPGMRVRVV